MKKMAYIKMDTTEQLLLGEGVCRQLGIVTYHPDVKQCLETAETSDAAVQVPTVRVQLLKSVSIPPRESICVAVKTTSSLRDQDTMMLDSDPDLTPDGVQVSPSLLNGGDGGVSVNCALQPFQIHMPAGEGSRHRHFGRSGTSHCYQSTRIRSYNQP